MKRFGELNDDSKCWVNKAIEVLGELDIDFIISSGRACKDGCTKCIGDTTREYLNHTGGIPISKIYVDINSRDTVGDAYFVKKNCST